MLSSICIPPYSQHSLANSFISAISATKPFSFFAHTKYRKAYDVYSNVDDLTTSYIDIHTARNNNPDKTLLASPLDNIALSKIHDMLILIDQENMSRIKMFLISLARMINDDRNFLYVKDMSFNLNATYAIGEGNELYGSGIFPFIHEKTIVASVANHNGKNVVGFTFTAYNKENNAESVSTNIIIPLSKILTFFGQHLFPTN